MLTPEQRKQLEELKALETAEAKKIEDDDIKKLSEAEKDKLVKDALEQKRKANDEAKTYREKLEAKEKAEKEADMSKDELLKTKDAEISKLLGDVKSAGLKSTAVADLTAKGFHSKVVDLAMNGLTDENYKDRVKSFEKEYEDLKKTPGQPNVPGRTTPPGDKKPPDIKQQQTAGKAAVMDLRQSKEINTAREIAEKEKFLSG